MVTKIWLPFLLLALVVALYFEFDSVETFDLQAGRGESIVSVPHQGQTVMHAHIHLIPRRDGDVEDPRGGVRGCVPGKMGY